MQRDTREMLLLIVPMETIDVKLSKTLTGISFKYSGSLQTGLQIYLTESSFPSSKKFIELIRLVIDKKSPVFMGANRDKPTPYSIGSTLRSPGLSPQHLSYVIPLLIEEGFCEASETKPFIISKVLVPNSLSVK